MRKIVGHIDTRENYIVVRARAKLPDLELASGGSEYPGYCLHPDVAANSMWLVLFKPKAHIEIWRVESYWSVPWKGLRAAQRG